MGVMMNILQEKAKEKVVKKPIIEQINWSKHSISKMKEEKKKKKENKKEEELESGGK